MAGQYILKCIKITDIVQLFDDINISFALKLFKNKKEKRNHNFHQTGIVEKLKMQFKIHK